MPDEKISLAPEPYMTTALMLLGDLLVLIRNGTNKHSNERPDWLQEVRGLADVLQYVPLSLVHYARPHSEQTILPLFEEFDKQYGPLLMDSYHTIPKRLDPRGQSVSFLSDHPFVRGEAIQIDLHGGRGWLAPLAGYPALASASEAQRNGWEWVDDGRKVVWKELEFSLDLQDTLHKPTQLASTPELVEAAERLNRGFARMVELLHHPTPDDVYQVNRLADALHNVPSDMRVAKSEEFRLMEARLREMLRERRRRGDD